MNSVVTFFRKSRWVFGGVFFLLQIGLIVWWALALQTRRADMLAAIKSGSGFDSESLVQRLPEILENIITHFPFWVLLIWSVICLFSQKELIIAHLGALVAVGLGALTALPIVSSSPQKIDYNIYQTLCPVVVLQIIRSLAVSATILLIIGWLRSRKKGEDRLDKKSRIAAVSTGILLIVGAAWTAGLRSLATQKNSGIESVYRDLSQPGSSGTMAQAALLGGWLVLFLLILIAACFFAGKKDIQHLTLPITAGILAEGFPGAFTGLFSSYAYGPGKAWILLAALAAVALMTMGTVWLRKKNAKTEATLSRRQSRK